MAVYQLKISGVHYAANGDSVAGQKDTKEMHVRTRELLSWIERERPMVVLVAEPNNYFEADAIIARAKGRRIGRVASECLKVANTLLKRQGQTMMLAWVAKVAVKEHGYVMVTVDAEELTEAQPLSTAEIEWSMWTGDLPLLPVDEPMMAEEEAEFVLDNVLMRRTGNVDVGELKSYMDIWLEGSKHDLSREARQKRSAYIEWLEAAQDSEVRGLAEALKQQRTSICGRTARDEHATVWWKERVECAEVDVLWRRWKLRNENKLWQGLRLLDSMLRHLPGQLYADIGRMDVVLSRLYYMNTPRRAFRAILALLMLRELTCRELGIEMRPMTDDEYVRDGVITNPLEMPTTIGRVVEFGMTLSDQSQIQTIQLLTQWLRDDYEQNHCREIDAMTEDKSIGRQERVINALEKVAERPVTQNCFLNQTEYNIEKNYGANVDVHDGGMVGLPDRSIKQ